MAFYDVFELLCKSKGVTPTQVARDNELTQQTVSHWKTRGSTPKAETVQKLADYFGVSVDYLLGIETKRIQRPSLNVGDSYFDGAMRVTHSDVEGKLASIVFEVDEDKMSANDLVSLMGIMEKISSQSGISIEGLALLAEAAAKAAGSAVNPPQNAPVSPDGKDTTPPPDGAQG